MEMPLSNDEAHKEANMMRVKLGDDPEAEYLKSRTPAEYNEALSELENLQEQASRESSSFDGKAARSMKDGMAGLVAIGGQAAELIGLAIASVAIGANPKLQRERDQLKLVEKIKGIPDDIKMVRSFMQSAHEKLEIWQKEAEVFSKKQTEQK